MVWTEGIPGSAWDLDVAHAGGHFLQTSHWAAFQRQVGHRVFYAEQESWRCLAVLQESRTGTRLYCPYGPIAASAAGILAALDALQELAARHDATFVRVEPSAPVDTAALAAMRLKPALRDVQPRLLWVLDMGPEDDVLAKMQASNRNRYRNHAKKGLTVRVSTDPADTPLFVSMMKEVGLRNNIVPHPDDYYQKMAEVLMPRNAGKLYLVEHEGRAVAGSMSFDSIDTRYYAHAASRYDARRLHPGTVLLAAMIVDAHAAGKTAFNFIGVAPPDAPEDHPWRGLTSFKQSFGGDYRPYAGTWELPVQRARYGLYRAAYRVELALRSC